MIKVERKATDEDGGSGWRGVNRDDKCTSSGFGTTKYIGLYLSNETHPHTAMAAAAAISAHLRSVASGSHGPMLTATG